MRAVCIVVACLASGPVLFGQNRTSGPAGSIQNMPGSVASRPAPPSWAPGLPPTSGLGASQGQHFSRGGRLDGGRRPVIVPYYYPVYYGGYGYDGYSQQPVVVNIENPPQQAPQVIINQTFVNGGPVPTDAQPDSFRTYQAPAATASDYAPPMAEASTSAPTNGPQYYLIAYKDHTILTALAYWMEGTTFHYVTTQNAHNQASIDLVDLDFTTRLNRERNVLFSLPMSH